MPSVIALATASFLPPGRNLLVLHLLLLLHPLALDRSSTFIIPTAAS